MRILILDNYDSFTYNLVHLLEKVCDIKYEVHRNDKISLKEVEAFDKIILSPGPGLPKDAGIMPQLLKEFSPTKSILGVCLGMQGIGELYGAGLKNLEDVFHGLATPIVITNNDVLFKDCPSEFHVGRYHSWAIDPRSLPDNLIVQAKDKFGNIMAIRHKMDNVRGIQFHPESILSEYGEQIISNWIKYF